MIHSGVMRGFLSKELGLVLKYREAVYPYINGGSTGIHVLMSKRFYSEGCSKSGFGLMQFC